MAQMRAKMKVTGAIAHSPEYLELTMCAVCKSDGYPPDGSDENNTFARWTPWAEVKMSITNPALVAQFTPGQEFYVDFTPAE